MKERLDTHMISTRVAMTSLVGIVGDPPVSYGNYCSVKEGYLVNMWAENLKALQDQLGDQMYALQIGPKHFWVDDPRIPKAYLHADPCFTGSDASKKTRELAMKLSWEFDHGAWPEDHCAHLDDLKFFEKDPDIGVIFDPVRLEIRCPACGEVWTSTTDLRKGLEWGDREYWAGLVEGREATIICGYKVKSPPTALGVGYREVGPEMGIAPSFYSTEPLDFDTADLPKKESWRLSYITKDSSKENP